MLWRISPLCLSVSYGHFPIRIASIRLSVRLFANIWCFLTSIWLSFESSKYFSFFCFFPSLLTQFIFVTTAVYSLCITILLPVVRLLICAICVSGYLSATVILTQQVFSFCARIENSKCRACFSCVLCRRVHRSVVCCVCVFCRRVHPKSQLGLRIRQPWHWHHVRYGGHLVRRGTLIGWGAGGVYICRIEARFTKWSCAIRELSKHAIDRALSYFSNLQHFDRETPAAWWHFLTYIEKRPYFRSSSKSRSYFCYAVVPIYL